MKTLEIRLEIIIPEGHTKEKVYENMEVVVIYNGNELTTEIKQ